MCLRNETSAMEEEVVTIRIASASCMMLSEMCICSSKKSLSGSSRVSLCLVYKSVFLITWLKDEGLKIQDRQLSEVI